MRNTLVSLTFLVFLLTSILVVVSFSVPSGLSIDQESIFVHFIDVGQGDAILIDTSGMDVLIDGGDRKAGKTVVDYLNNLDITQIHLVVATHMYSDHIGGLISVLDSTIQVDKIIINNQSHDTKTYDDFKALADEHTIRVAQMDDMYILSNIVNITVLNPVQPLEFRHQNENSVVIRLQIGESSFLLTGDAEVDSEESMLNVGLNLDSDVLKVGHHGSTSSTTDDFLKAVSPSYAIISAAKKNKYDHPHKETLDRLNEHGITLYTTFESGSIVFYANSTSVTLQNVSPVITEVPSYSFSSSLLVKSTSTLIYVTPILIALRMYKKRNDN